MFPVGWTVPSAIQIYRLDNGYSRDHICLPFAHRICSREDPPNTRDVGQAVCVRRQVTTTATRSASIKQVLDATTAVQAS